MQFQLHYYFLLENQAKEKFKSTESLSQLKVNGVYYTPYATIIKPVF